MEKLCREGHLKRSGKRLLALLMSVCMIGTMLPITAKAATVVTLGAFEITGGTKDVDYSYGNEILTIKDGANITIKNTDPNEPTNDHIEVEAGASVNITLAGVNIDVSGRSSVFCAFKIADDSTGDVTITIADGSVNTLKSGIYCAGLQKNADNVKLVIDGTGTLNATGGNGGAGIGGGKEGNGSYITINGGTIKATSGDNDRTNSIWSGAGIGGGYKGKGEYITINGGTITAKAQGTVGAGIGGGYCGNGSYITISGGTVTATTTNHGAGIGGGSGGSGSNITISGGTVTATAQGLGAGIGGGDEADGADIVITGGSVKASSSSANAIGGGSNSSGAVTPTLDDEAKTPVYLLEIANTNGDYVSIDGKKYPTHSDDKVYAYLTTSPAVGNTPSEWAQP